MKYWAAKGSSNLQYFLNVKRKHSWFLCEICGGVKKKPINGHFKQQEIWQIEPILQSKSCG